jgi:glycosyltransferase involved in cell wall biosynthesis
VRILYVEAGIDHHSLPLAHGLYDLLPENCFAYAGLRPPSDERRALGWSSGEMLPWMMPAGPVGADSAKFHDWWQNADFVICAPRLYDLMEQRIRREKCVFYTSERWFKPPIGRLRLLHPAWAWKAMKYRRMAKTRFMHYLAIGPYAASDMQWFCPMPGRLWSWGYFTTSSAVSPCRARDAGFRVLWAGRMLNWKRVDTLIRAFAGLLKTRPDAVLTLIGAGPEKDRLSQLAAANLPQDCYAFLPPVAAGEIREHMRNSHVYVLPSSGFEGWGAVVGEAMTEGCAVVTAVETGAAKTLIQDRANGMLFSSGDERRLAEILSELGANAALRQSLADAGKATIDGVWSPSAAAERFMSVADAMLSRRDAPTHHDGPMRRL